MNFLTSIRADLVEKRLLPVAVLLAVMAVLVPVGAGVLLSSGSSQPVIGPPPAAAPPPGTPSPANALASVSGGAPTAKHYTAREVDPFRLPAAALALQAAAAAKTRAGANATSATKVSPAAAKPATTTSTTRATPVTPTTAVKVPTPATVAPTAPVVTPPTTPVATPSPQAQLAKLGRRDSYAVDASVVDATGSHSLTDVVRLSPLPSQSNPLVEYLGVLKSGRAAAFLVNPGTVAQGAGACLPAARDCQVLVLKPGQLETLSVRTGSGPVIQASIAVSGWRVVTHSSVAAARKARAQEVKQGRTLVTQAGQPALTDLIYSVAQGAVSVVPAIVNALPGALTKLLGG